MPYKKSSHPRKGAKNRSSSSALVSGKTPNPRMRHAPQVLIGQSALAAINRVPSNAVVSVWKWGSPTAIVQTNVASFGGYQFTLADTEAVSIGAYFQQYRIAKVQIWFRPVFTANAAADQAAFAAPLIYAAVDPNDISSWGTLAGALATDNVVVSNDQQTFMLSFEPSPLMAVYAGASTFTAFAHLDMPYWIDTQDTTVRHYGIKYAVTAGLTHFQQWEVTIRENVEFRYGR